MWKKPDLFLKKKTNRYYHYTQPNYKLPLSKMLLFAGQTAKFCEGMFLYASRLTV